MSTKIYKGYKLPNMSLLELQKFCMKLKKEIREELDENYLRVSSQIATNIIDDIIFNVFDKERWKDYIFEEKISPMSATEKTLCLKRKEIASLRKRDPFFDFSFDVSFLPLKDKILAIVFTERKSFEEIFKNQPEVEYYGYWNNTDQPEGVTEEEWDQRRDEWDEALGDEYVPALRGFTFDPIANHYPWPSKQDLVDNQPDLDSREARIIERLLQKSFPKVYDKSNFYDYFRDYQEWLEKNPKEREKAKKSIKIKEKLEKEDYLKKYKVGDII